MDDLPEVLPGVGFQRVGGAWLANGVVGQLVGLMLGWVRKRTGLCHAIYVSNN